MLLQILYDRIHNYRSPNLTKAGLIFRRVVVYAKMWNIWLERNNRIFGEKERQVGEVWNRVVE